MNVKKHFQTIHVDNLYFVKEESNKSEENCNAQPSYVWEKRSCFSDYQA